jgi:hypothetical protein
MRALIWAALVIVLLPLSAEASPRCGEGRYWAHGHHDRDGNWHPGHCRPYSYHR